MRLSHNHLVWKERRWQRLRSSQKQQAATNSAIENLLSLKPGGFFGTAGGGTPEQNRRLCTQ